MASRFKAPTDFVFCTAEGRGRDQRSTARGVERAIEAAKLNGHGISSHNFRHTYASLLIVGLKLDPVVVAGQLGHANPAVTLGTYAHLFDRARHADETRERFRLASVTCSGRRPRRLTFRVDIGDSNGVATPPERRKALITGAFL